MRSLAGLTALALLSVGGAAAAAPAASPPARAPAPTTAAPAKPAGPYVVVQGMHTVTADPGQRLTVFCPAGHHVLAAGYSAVVRTAPAAQGGKPGTMEGGLDQVRSAPDMQGSGWQVSGFSPDAIRTKQPWALVVRLVCLHTPG